MEFQHVVEMVELLEDVAELFDNQQMCGAHWRPVQLQHVVDLVELQDNDCD